MIEISASVKQVLALLERLGVPYFLCGSVASSIHGVPRGTIDVHLVAAVRKEHIPALVEALSEDFYADSDMMEKALRENRAFNLIHYASSYKFDIFPLTADPYAQVQFERRSLQSVPLGGGETLVVPVASAEDTVLSKLAWFRAGGGVSERQWSDVRGILEIQGQRLGRAYLSKWAKYLGIADLLERAQARGGPPAASL